MIQVAINPAVFKWALERSNNPASVERKFPKLAEWMRGEKQPTLRKLDEFAKATSTPLGYLFLPEPPEERLPIPHFRTMDAGHLQEPSPNLLETVNTLVRRQDWMRDGLIEKGSTPS